MPRGVYDRKTKPRPDSQEASPGGTSLTSSSRQGGATLKVHIWPSFKGDDNGDGGVRRVVEGQIAHLANHGIEVVDDPDEADVIACHISIPPTYLVRFPNKPIVAHCHGLYWSNYEWANWALEANVRVMELIRLADVVTAPSEWVANAIRRNASRDVRVVPHGVDAGEWENEEQSLNYVLWNKTRPDPVCDPEPVNKVASLLPDIEFVSTFGEEAQNVILTGRLPFAESRKLVKKAGVYLATSKETFGIGTLEAMAAGVPVVGFDWGGQSDIVRPGIDGYLVRPGDISGLASAIQTALSEREVLSVNARERAAEFTWDRAASAYASLYREASATAKVHDAGPRCTVLVTNYNLAGYLRDCLNSVASQTDPNWECIIVDDASPEPEGREIAKEYVEKDGRFKLIVNEKNLYLAEARNVGIRAARGKYILPLDADDMLAPETLQLLGDALDKDKSIHVAYGNVMFVNENGRDVTVYDGREHTPGFSGWPMQFAFEHQMRQRNMLPYCSMYRKSVWTLTGGYRPRCRTAEDADFWSRISSYGFRPKMVTEATTLIYRNREGSMSRVQGQVDWIKWFPWARNPEITPAGAATASQLPVPSFDTPVVSVIIPVGPAHVSLVRDAVDSVDAQFFRNWECIVVNDSGMPLPELPTWVRIMETASPASGVAAARNLGIRAAKAPTFLPLDADDYLQPFALKAMVEAYIEHRDIIYSDMWEDPKVEGEFSIYEFPDYDANRLTHGTLHCVTALTPKSAWEKVGGYDESLPAWEDWDFQIKCADAGICSRRLAAPLWVYRKHTGLRRDDNLLKFEESKQGILSKWSSLWEGRKELMACRSCSGKATIHPASAMASGQSQARVASQPSGNFVLVQYTGERRGNVSYRGKSGTYYTFSAGDQPKYVLESDAQMFVGRKDFTIRAYSPEVPVSSSEPTLTAASKV